MRGWVILLVTFLVGVVVGIGAANRGPAVIAPYLPKAVSGVGKQIEGEIVRKQRDGNRLLVKINTAQGPMVLCSSPSLRKCPTWTYSSTRAIP